MAHNKLKIVFVGIPDMAGVCMDKILEKKLDIVCVVPPKKTHETYPYFREFVKSKGIDFLEFDKNPDECIERIKSYNADIGVVCAYNDKLSKEFLSSTRLGYLNCHPSKLPDYRGGMPYFHIIKNGEKKSGVTIHFMDETFDTGDIVYQEVFEILPWETMGTLFNRTTYMLSNALVNVLEDIQEGKKIKRIHQKDSKKLAPKVEDNHKIDWSKSVFEIDCLIRACNPFFCANTSFRDVNMKVIKATPIQHDHKLPLGKIARAGANCLLVTAKDGYMSLDVVQVGTWGVFGIKEFFYTFSPNEEEYLR